MPRGALHIHSTYSDGERTLAQLRSTFQAAGCCFICTTDHAEAFDEARVDEYRRECESLSDETFAVVGGLEYRCDGGMHVLGYGVTALIDSTDPAEVFEIIARHGGVSVVAHPKTAMFPDIEALAVLPNGIEAWNSKYDGRYAPRPGTFQLIERLRARRPDLHAFYGQDLHWMRQCRSLLTAVEGDAFDRQAVLSALAAGDFAGLKGKRRFPASGSLARSELQRLEATHRWSQRLRLAMRGVKTRAEAIGVWVPSPVKAQLRRIF
jgi:hypothetical protein